MELGAAYEGENSKLQALLKEQEETAASLPLQPEEEKGEGGEEEEEKHETEDEVDEMDNLSEEKEDLKEEKEEEAVSNSGVRQTRATYLFLSIESCKIAHRLYFVRQGIDGSFSPPLFF